jgi:hypothetical protein
MRVLGAVVRDSAMMVSSSNDSLFLNRGATGLLSAAHGVA